MILKFIDRMLEIIAKLILWSIALFAIGVIVVIFIILKALGDPSSNSQNEASLEAISTEIFWPSALMQTIPRELRRDNSIIAQNFDGFVDTLRMGIFKLNGKDTNSLLSLMKSSYEVVNKGRDINTYAENALCFGKVAYGPWSINIDKQDDFREFCDLIGNVNKEKWEMTIPLGNREPATISITHYEASHFFTVTH